MQNILERVVTEFRIRMFEESFARIRKCLEMINEEDLWSQPNSKITSIGSNIQHIEGNSRQWIVSTLGQFEDVRERSLEFESNNNNKKGLLELIEKLEYDLDQIMVNLTTNDLDREYVVQNFHVTGFSLLIHVIEHTSYHTGQISLLTKLYTDQDLGYYDGHELE